MDNKGHKHASKILINTKIIIEEPNKTKQNTNYNIYGYIEHIKFSTATKLPETKLSLTQKKFWRIITFI